MCSAMMNLFVKNNQARELTSLFQQLSLWKLPQDSSLGYVVSMVCKSNDDKQLDELLNQITQQGFILDIPTCDDLAVHFYNTKQYSKISELNDQIRQRGSIPGPFILSWQIYSLIELGQTDKAVDLWLEMKQNKIPPHGILG